MNNKLNNLPMLQARDHKVIIDVIQLQQLISSVVKFKDVQQNVREWLVDVYEQTTSDAFNKFHKRQLQEGEEKVYAAKNYIANIVILIQKIKYSKKDINEQVSKDLFKFINQQSKEIINELILKYPQSQTKASTKKLKKIIQRPDNKEKDQYDLLLDPKETGIEFKYKENGNYSSEIMKALNYIMQIASKPLCQKSQYNTNFDGFRIILENLFNLSGSQSFQDKFQVDLINKDKTQQGFNALHLFAKMLSTNDNQKVKQQQYSQKILQQIFLNEDNDLEEYKKLMKDQIDYKINQKIQSNVKLFSKQEIESGIFRVPDMTVLRVMTKWAEQLKQKITNSYQLIKRRAEKFKTKNGQLVSLNSHQKQALYQAIEYQQKYIDNIVKKLKQHYQIMVTRILEDNPKSLYTNQIDGAVGIFAARTQTYIGKYMFEYLNALIHSLMRVPIKAKQILKMVLQNNYKYDSQKILKQLQQISLVSFKIGDLLRAKCKASQKHIINIFKFLKKMNQNYPKIMRFVRVKDRLDGKDNDLLINLFFMDKIQCEIQLSVATHINPKQQHYNSFNHFIYQLKRAQFGPIAQCACILSQYDPVIKNYCQRQQLSPKIKIQQTKQINRQQYLNKQNKSPFINNLPYFCSVCNKLDRNKNQQFYKNKIMQNNFKECNNCYEKYLKQKYKQDLLKQLLRQRFKQKQINTIIKHYEIKNNNQNQIVFQNYKQIKQGLIISKSSLKPHPEYFTTLIYDQKLFFVSYYQKNQHIQGKILLKVNLQNKMNQKLLKQFIIIRLKNTKGLKINKENNKIILQCKCCQINKIQMGKYTNGLKFVKLSQIQKIYKDISKSLKQTMNVANKDLERQLQIDINKEISNIKIFNCANNSISTMKFVLKIPNVQQIDLKYNKINKLQNLQYLHSLTTLYLSYNQISKIQNLYNLNSLTTLYLEWNNITKLQNLQLIKNLKNLNLRGNKIGKVQNLKSLTNLQYLSLDKNQISKMQNLQYLTNLKTLNLYGNKIAKLQNIQYLKNLKNLYLVGNKINKLQNLKSFKNLTNLNLRANKISKLENLQYLKNLSTLYLNYNQISKLQNLQHLNHLTALYLDWNNIMKIQNLEYLNQLQTLNLQNNQISKLQNFESLTNLITLSINNNQINKLQNLQSLNNLSTLNLSYNKIIKLQNFSSITNLTTLDISANQIAKLQNLQCLIYLTYLSLDYNHIKKLQNLQSLTYLTYLNLNNNKIQKLQNLQSLINLTTISLNNNQISKLQNLQSLINLTTLSLNQNQISKLQNFESLINLTSIYLDNNKIQKLQNLQSLNNLTTISLIHNQISKLQNFDSFINLTSLYLAENNITKLQNIQSLKNLITLNLRGNHITKLQNIQALNNLAILNLKQNQISKLQNLQNLTNLTSLFIQQNPIAEKLKLPQNYLILSQLKQQMPYLRL